MPCMEEDQPGSLLSILDALVDQPQACLTMEECTPDPSACGP